MAKTKLNYLTLEMFVDACYYCAVDKTPVFGYIAGGTGTGKTWSTEALKNETFVKYMNKVYSPQEHRAEIAKNAPRTKLLINDDLGLCSRWNAKDYFSTFIMAMDGEISYTQYKNTMTSTTNFSVVLCSTSTYFDQNRAAMDGMGLLDRMMLFAVGLSEESREIYQRHAIMSMNGRHPPIRQPIRHYTRDMVNNPFPLMDYNLNPRNINNLKHIQKYLDDESMAELIGVVNGPAYDYQV